MKELYKYNRAFYDLMSAQESYARQQGMNGKKFQLLLWLYRSPKGIFQQTLAEKTFSTKQVVNAAIKKWKDQGYVEFQADKNDKRAKKVLLTKAGRSYAASIIDTLDQAEESAFGSLNAAEQEQLGVLVTKYAQALITELESRE